MEQVFHYWISLKHLLLVFVNLNFVNYIFLEYCGAMKNEFQDAQVQFAQILLEYAQTLPYQISENYAELEHCKTNSLLQKKTLLDKQFSQYFLLYFPQC